MTEHLSSSLSSPPVTELTLYLLLWGCNPMWDIWQEIYWWRKEFLKWFIVGSCNNVVPNNKCKYVWSVCRVVSLVYAAPSSAFQSPPSGNNTVKPIDSGPRWHLHALLCDFRNWVIVVFLPKQNNLDRFGIVLLASEIKVSKGRVTYAKHLLEMSDIQRHIPSDSAHSILWQSQSLGLPTKCKWLWMTTSSVQPELSYKSRASGN